MGTKKSTESVKIENKIMGILTSGGDSQGMNAVIWAAVKSGLSKGFKVYLIFEGYNGLIKGGDQIKEANLQTVDHIIHRGGTCIGSSRCQEFRTLDGRITAALNLIKKNITNLVIIGGDGSLTGANILRQEWVSITNTLHQKGKISEEMKLKNSNLNIVGIVGSIDNDFCGTEITTGTDTALHRIIEAVDAITTTASSHQRAMIVEVMGRNCGYLALVSALALEATYTFIPECPPPKDWEQILCAKMETERKNGLRLNIIIVSEGAKDLNGNKITSTQIKNIVKKHTKIDTRITILGHVQRGGCASAFDRILGYRMGASVVKCLSEATPETESCVLALNGNRVVRKSLVECVKQTLEVGVAMKNMEWDKCLQLRGKGFNRNFETYKILNKLYDNNKPTANRYAVIQVGEPTPGSNAAILAFVRYLIFEGHSVFGIFDGVDGMVAGNIKPLKWSDVSGWACRSGALLGTSKILQLDQQMPEIAKQLGKLKINGLLVVGGFRAFQMVLKFIESRNKFNELKIPFCIIPATIDNNIPGTEFSLGTDSALNKITQLCTDIYASSVGTKRRLFIIKLETGYCGYLTLLSAIASGADYCYLFEENFTLEDVKRDVMNIKNVMKSNESNRMIIVNGFANMKLKTKSIADIYTEEGKDVFTTYFVDLENLQQSLSPSPFDRIFGIKMGVKCADWIEKTKKIPESENTVVIGLEGMKYEFKNVMELIKKTDFEHEMPKNQWFLGLKDLKQ